MIHAKKNIILIILISIAYLFSCTKEIVTPEDIDFSKVPYSNLSEYGFYQGDLQDLIPSDRLLEYKPNSELFSDYAEKKRFVWMPLNSTAKIDLDDDGRIIFPDQTILVKNFYYSNAEHGNQRIIETRLLVKKGETWNAYAYLWNEEQTEATYEIIGASIPVSFTTKDNTHHNIEYIQPNKNQCKSCHNVDEKLLPIGPKVQHLNYEYNYGNQTFNQLERWVEAGYLETSDNDIIYPCMIDYKDTSKSLDERAKAYLDMNCAHCHTEKGPASTSGLFLNYNETNHTKWGINKPPIAAGIGAGPHKYDIMPGKSDSSIYIFRMESKKPGIMMPELGRSTVHVEGVQLIRDWIDNMDAIDYQ